MNWEALGTIAEIVGAIAVVVSLVYLAIQIRTNTKAIKASSSFEVAHSWSEFNKAVLSLPDETLALSLKAYDPETQLSDLTDVEYFRMVAMHRTIFQSLEGQYYQYKYGFLEPGVWQNRVKVARGILDLPVFRAWWMQEQKNSTYSDEFIEAIDSAEAVETFRINRKPEKGEPGAA